MKGFLSLVFIVSTFILHVVLGSSLQNGGQSLASFDEKTLIGDGKFFEKKLKRRSLPVSSERDRELTKQSINQSSENIKTWKYFERSSEEADSREGYYLRKAKGFGKAKIGRQKNKGSGSVHKREAKSNLQPRSVKYIPLNSLTLLKHHQMKNGEAGGTNKLWWEALPAKRKDKNKIILEELDKLRESVPDWPWLGNNSNLLQKRDPAKISEKKYEEINLESSEKMATETTTRAIDQTLPWLFPPQVASNVYLTDLNDVELPPLEDSLPADSLDNEKILVAPSIVESLKLLGSITAGDLIDDIFPYKDTINDEMKPQLSDLIGNLENVLTTKSPIQYGNEQKIDQLTHEDSVEHIEKGPGIPNWPWLMDPDQSKHVGTLEERISNHTQVPDWTWLIDNYGDGGSHQKSEKENTNMSSHDENLEIDITPYMLKHRQNPERQPDLSRNEDTDQWSLARTEESQNEETTSSIFPDWFLNAFSTFDGISTVSTTPTTPDTTPSTTLTTTKITTTTTTTTQTTTTTPTVPLTFTTTTPATTTATTTTTAQETTKITTTTTTSTTAQTTPKITISATTVPERTSTMLTTIITLPSSNPLSSTVTLKNPSTLQTKTTMIMAKPSVMKTSIKVVTTTTTTPTTSTTATTTTTLKTTTVTAITITSDEDTTIHEPATTITAPPVIQSETTITPETTTTTPTIITPESTITIEEATTTTSATTTTNATTTTSATTTITATTTTTDSPTTIQMDTTMNDVALSSVIPNFLKKLSSRLQQSELDDRSPWKRPVPKIKLNANRVYINRKKTDHSQGFSSAEPVIKLDAYSLTPDTGKNHSNFDLNFFPLKDLSDMDNEPHLKFPSLSQLEKEEVKPTPRIPIPPHSPAETRETFDHLASLYATRSPSIYHNKVSSALYVAESGKESQVQGVNILIKDDEAVPFKINQTVSHDVILERPEVVDNTGIENMTHHFLNDAVKTEMALTFENKPEEISQNTKNSIVNEIIENSSNTMINALPEITYNIGNEVQDTGSDVTEDNPSANAGITESEENLFAMSKVNPEEEAETFSQESKFESDSSKLTPQHLSNSGPVPSQQSLNRPKDFVLDSTTVTPEVSLQTGNEGLIGQIQRLIELNTSMMKILQDQLEAQGTILKSIINTAINS